MLRYIKRLVIQRLQNPLQKGICCILVVFCLGVFNHEMFKGVCKNPCSNPETDSDNSFHLENPLPFTWQLERTDMDIHFVGDTVCCDGSYILPYATKLFILLENNNLLKDKPVHSTLDADLPGFTFMDKKPRYSEPVNVINFPSIISSIVLNC